MFRIAALGLCLTAAGPAAQAADPVAGKFWYEQNCARCHGSPPQERQAGTPNITGYPAERIRYAIGNVVAMTKVRLDEAQILDVEAYLRRPLDYLWVPGLDYSGLWWAPSESGWGLTLSQRPNARLAGVLFIYTADGNPLWLSLSDLNWVNAQTAQGQLLQTRAAAGFPVQSFSANSVSLRGVGAITLRFTAADSATIEFDIEGQTYRRNIQRVPF